MMPRAAAILIVASLVASCVTGRDPGTLAELKRVDADVAEVDVADSLELAMEGYRRFLEETPDGRMTPEAMRRLADLKIEQQFGIIGDGEIVELPAPGPAPIDASADPAAVPVLAGGGPAESDADFEARTTRQFELAFGSSDELVLPNGTAAPELGGPLEAIRIYRQLLAEYPRYERADQVLYQMARAYDEVGRPDDAMAVMQRLVDGFSFSNYLDEVYFRRGEYLFTRREFRAAEREYEAILALGEGSAYYELALYKLGWALYKQEFYDEALARFMALLDYKLSIGYDLDRSEAEADERRVADTFRVISLSFSNIGGPDVVSEFFATAGRRSYEDRIYRNLGEFYLEKLRFHDAAAVYAAFIELNPYHRVAPAFSMRIVDIYELGGFPLLVVAAKKEFAGNYGLRSDYWDYFEPADTPEVLDLLKTNLDDLATHYHALYQDETLVDEQPGYFAEATGWYREYLDSFPADSGTPPIHYRFADLLLEDGDYAGAALEYERTAYGYEPHEQASAAGYAAIYAHREHLALVGEEAHAGALRATVASSLRFADTFPGHENAPIVLGAAADDLYSIDEFKAAIIAGGNLIDRYPEADAALRRAAWTVVAHASFDLERYAEAETAYARVLEFAADTDEDRASLIDNLAASIYQQGETAIAAGDDRTAATHFLRVGQAAPTSAIRSSAEYDAAAALIRLEDWAGAGTVLENFREAFPGHALTNDVTRQLAGVYRQAGELDRSAGEYERVAAEATDPELEREALLLAGELYEQSAALSSAVSVYERYVERFPQPLDMAQETRFTLTGLYETLGDAMRRRELLEAIVAADAGAGVSRTDRSRFLAAHSALELTETLYEQFVAVRLTQPFDISLAEKRGLMDTALGAFERLVAYEVGEVTAAATYYIAEIYFEFSESLLQSERPDDLTPAELTDYELAIEDEAFPFEERAIEVHEQNFALIRTGMFNDWVERSLGKLAAVMPGRYAKDEISGGFVGSIDSYAYRSPGAPPAGIANDGSAGATGLEQARLTGPGDGDVF